MEAVAEIITELQALPEYRFKGIPDKEIYTRIPMSKSSFYTYRNACGMAPITLQAVPQTSDVSVESDAEAV